MRYSGIQPQYFPRLHYFARILNTDVFMIRDDVQYVRNHKYPDGKRGSSYQADSPIKLSTGEHLLRLPINHDGLIPINKTNINYNERWVYSHVGTVQAAYGQSLNFKKMWKEFREILGKKYNNLTELNCATIYWGVLHLLGEENITVEKLNLDYVNKRLKKDENFRLSEIRLGSKTKASRDDSLDANHKIIALLKEIGANEDYCGGTAHAAYMNEKLLNDHGIKVTVQDWKCKEYDQGFARQQKFIPNLSILDLLMNVQHDEAVKIING